MINGTANVFNYGASSDTVINGVGNVFIHGAGCAEQFCAVNARLTRPRSGDVVTNGSWNVFEANATLRSSEFENGASKNVVTNGNSNVFANVAFHDTVINGSNNQFLNATAFDIVRGGNGNVFINFGAHDEVTDGNSNVFENLAFGDVVVNGSHNTFNGATGVNGPRSGFILENVDNVTLAPPVVVPSPPAPPLPPFNTINGVKVYTANYTDATSGRAGGWFAVTQCGTTSPLTPVPAASPSSGGTTRLRASATPSSAATSAQKKNKKKCRT